MIWRVELLSGKGFYREYHEYFNVYHTDRHKGPHEDHLRSGKALSKVLTYDHRFGFATLKQAREWFYSARDCANMEFCQLVCYSEYHTPRHAKTQSIFIPTSEKKAVFSMADLHQLSSHKLMRSARQQLGLI